jgi:hypothetical protein
VTVVQIQYFSFGLRGRRDNGTKCCRKMKRRQRTHLTSMEMKRDTARRRNDVDRMRVATREGKGMRRCQLS